METYGWIAALLAAVAASAALTALLVKVRRELAEARAVIVTMENAETKTRVQSGYMRQRLAASKSALDAEREVVQELMSMRMAMDEASPGRIRHYFEHVHASLKNEIARERGRDPDRARDLQEKSACVLTILHGLVSTRLDDELVDAVRYYTTRNELIRDRVTEMFGERLAADSIETDDARAEAAAS